MSYAGHGAAAAVLRAWRAGTSPRHIANAASAVYAVELDGRRCVLRLTDASFRSREVLEAEIDFTEHLGRAGLAVSRAVRSANGAFVEDTGENGVLFHATLSTWAPGVVVDDGSPLLTRSFARGWGAAVAELHHASARYVEPSAAPGRRWRWDEEIWIEGAATLLDSADADVRALLNDALAALHRLSEDRSTFGLIHGGGPLNFRFAPERRTLTHFGFGSACYHWYVMDILPALLYLRRIDGGAAGVLAHAFADGYAALRPIDPAVWTRRLDLLRLRRVSAYLARLWCWGPAPADPDRTAVLKRARELAVEGLSW